MTDSARTLAARRAYALAHADTRAGFANGERTTATPTTRRAPEYRITQDGHGVVTLTLSGDLLAYLDSGEPAETQTRRYVVRGRYVYEINPRGNDRQVCEALGSRGYTLTATVDSLPRVIRREVRAAQRAARRFWS